MAVLRGWLDGAASIQSIGLFHRRCAFPSSGTSKCKRVGAAKYVGTPGSGEERAATWMISLTSVNQLFKDTLRLHCRRLPHRGLLRGFLLESETGV